MYIDLVLCKHDKNDNNFLFYAPAWSRLEKDDEVIVDTKYGESKAVVVDKVTVDKTSEEYEFIVKATGATTPLRKVLSKVLYREFDYDFDYEEETEEKENGIDND